jgi:hypothetical protein
LDDEELAAEMGRRGRARAVAVCSLRASADDHIRAFEVALREGSGRSGG